MSRKTSPLLRKVHHDHDDLREAFPDWDERLAEIPPESHERYAEMMRGSIIYAAWRLRAAITALGQAILVDSGLDRAWRWLRGRWEARATR